MPSLEMAVRVGTAPAVVFRNFAAGGVALAVVEAVARLVPLAAGALGLCLAGALCLRWRCCCRCAPA